MAKILITGANGFIGSNLCRYFLEKGFDVYAFVRKSSDLHFLDGLNVKLIWGDLLVPENIDIPQDTEYVIHSASIVSDTAEEETCQKHIFLLAVNLMQKIEKLNIKLKKMIYISTALTLGYNALNISEENPGESAMFLPYTRYKKKTEEYLMAESKRNGIPLIVLHPTDVYGPNDRTSCGRMLKVAEKRIPLIVGHGNWFFGFCYSENLCLAVYLACLQEGIQGKAFTVSNSVFPTWREFFSGLQRGLKKKQLVYMPICLAFFIAGLYRIVKKLFPKFDPPVTYYRIKRITTHNTYDISKTIKELNYHPTNDTEAQIQSIVDWYLAEKQRGYM